MYNPLIENISQLKDSDIENKIAELNKKYMIAARSGNGAVCHQIQIVIEIFREEMRDRMAEKSKKQMSDKDNTLGSLINIE